MNFWLTRPIQSLPPDIRLERYLRYAREARQKAWAAGDNEDLRDHLLAMASAWRLLAEELQRLLEMDPPQQT